MTILTVLFLNACKVILLQFSLLMSCSLSAPCCSDTFPWLSLSYISQFLANFLSLFLHDSDTFPWLSLSYFIQFLANFLSLFRHGSDTFPWLGVSISSPQPKRTPPLPESDFSHI